MKNISILFYTLLFFALLPGNGYAAGGKTKYLHGYFLDSAQHKMEGLIAFDGTDCENFLFKKQLGEKAVSINAAKCSQFKMGDHLYQTIDHIDFVVFIRKRPLTRAFAEVLDTGKVKLYRVTLSLSSRDKVHKISSSAVELSGSDGSGLSGYLSKVRNFYFVKRDTEEKYTRLESRNSKFKHQLKTYLEDRPDVLAALKSNKDYTYNNIEEIIHTYNSPAH